MDEVLRYFVVHDYVCNGDSYTGSMVHNYYLHESDGKLSMIPWDYNLAFGGFNGGDATATVNAPIDDPTSSGMGFGGFAKRDSAEEKTGEEAGEDDGASNETSGDEVQRFGGSDMPQMPEGMQPPTDGNMPSFSGEQSNSTNDDGNSSSSNNAPMSFNAGSGSSDSRPMVDWIFSDEQYTQAYHELYQQFLNEVDIQGIIDETEALIAPYVERDPTKFCTYEEFQTGVDTLRTFCNLRSQSVQGQFDGTIPSTEEASRRTLLHLSTPRTSRSPTWDRWATVAVADLSRATAHNRTAANSRIATRRNRTPITRGRAATSSHQLATLRCRMAASNHRTMAPDRRMA